MMTRDTLIQEFLAASGWANAKRAPLAADASNRSYERLNHPDGRIAILMNAPPESNESILIFHEIAERLRAVGLSAPQIYAMDDAVGLMLLEDLGKDLFANLVATTPEIEHEIYACAIDALCTLHQSGNCRGLAPYDAATYRREAALLTDWYLPNATQSDFDSDQFLNLVSTACGTLDGDQVLVQRDYHAENLLWLPNRTGVAKVGLLDFQDALAGHPAYDLVSLLEDARRDTSQTLQEEMKARYCAQMNLDVAQFNQAYAVLGAQRNLKIIGIFARLCIRDNKAHYVDLIPRVWAHLQRDLEHPILQEVKRWVDQFVPEPTDEILNQLRSARTNG